MKFPVKEILAIRKYYTSSEKVSLIYPTTYKNDKSLKMPNLATMHDLHTVPNFCPKTFCGEAINALFQAMRPP